jgi:hypothetical protein
MDNLLVIVIVDILYLIQRVHGQSVGCTNQITAGPAGAIKLTFRKLNSILCEQGSSMRRTDNLRRATRAGRNPKAEAVQFDDRSDHTQA